MKETRVRDGFALSVAGIGTVFMLLAAVFWVSAKAVPALPTSVPHGGSGTNIHIDLNALPATGAGGRDGQRLETALGGKRLVGRVSRRYDYVADALYADPERLPWSKQMTNTVRFVEVEFPDRLPNGNGSTSARLIDSSDAQIGDIVEIRIAHKHNPRFFPVREVTRVTDLVAKRDSAFARDFERRIRLARRAQSALQAVLYTDRP